MVNSSPINSYHSVQVAGFGARGFGNVSGQQLELVVAEYSCAGAEVVQLQFLVCFHVLRSFQWQMLFL